MDLVLWVLLTTTDVADYSKISVLHVYKGYLILLQGYISTLEAV